MESPLVPPHLPKDHPLVTRDYSLFTPSINAMVAGIGQWLDDQMDGGVVFGPSRFGKSSGVDNWLGSMLMERCGQIIPLIIWSHSECSFAGIMYGSLLRSANHGLANNVRNSLQRKHQLIEKVVNLAFEGGGRFVVLVIDESQGMTEREWLWLVEIHSLLEKERIRLTVISIASVQIFDQPMALALTGGAHAAARFMLSQYRFLGISSEDELEFVLLGYDSGTEWPKGSGISFTEGVAPLAWSKGFRMADCASLLWKTMVDELPPGYSGPMEFPMKTISQVSRNILLRIASGADPLSVVSKSSIREVVTYCGHKQLMSIVGAVAPRLLRGK
ncbi:hypothetical protein SAMN04489707_103242 [Paenacidovorax caeni]|uniref:AAA domain-containing protein n=1 Tax=Paenacidovorax caeni TaxID=343013 RepID=A0A1I7JWP7_9BURK|nr:hypothetical protein [Paenacidovorax caeni]SFU89529.1 hypothetical protein SAMN04489707_103242 [Paenacidovorax caeni]